MEQKQRITAAANEHKSMIQTVRRERLLHQLFGKINKYACNRWLSNIQKQLDRELEAVDDLYVYLPEEITDREKLLELECKEFVMIFSEEDENTLDFLMENYHDEYVSKRESRDKRFVDLMRFVAACNLYGRGNSDAPPTIVVDPGDPDYLLYYEALENSKRSESFMYVRLFLYFSTTLVLIHLIVLLYNDRMQDQPKPSGKQEQREAMRILFGDDFSDNDIDNKYDDAKVADNNKNGLENNVNNNNLICDRKDQINVDQNDNVCNNNDMTDENNNNMTGNCDENNNQITQINVGNNGMILDEPEEDIIMNESGVGRDYNLNGNNTNNINGNNNTINVNFNVNFDNNDEWGDWPAIMEQIIKTTNY